MVALVECAILTDGRTFRATETVGCVREKVIDVVSYQSPRLQSNSLSKSFVSQAIAMILVDEDTHTPFSLLIKFLFSVVIVT